MKRLDQHGGTQTSILVREEHSWHEKSILDKARPWRKNRPSSLHPVGYSLMSISHPAGKTWHPHALQVSGHAESLQKCLPGTTQSSCGEHRSVSLNPTLESSVQSFPHPLPCGRHCYLLTPKDCFLFQKPKLKVQIWIAARHLSSLRAESLPRGKFWFLWIFLH